MGIQNRDYMREDSDGNIIPRPSFWDYKPRLKGLDEHPAESPLKIEFPGDDGKPGFTKKQKLMMGGLGAMIPILFFAFGLDFLMIPSHSAIKSEQARQERLRQAHKEEYYGTVPAATIPVANQTVIVPVPRMRTTTVTGEGVIRLVDITRNGDYKVVRLRSLDNSGLVGTVLVRPGESLELKVPYDKPFRVTAITTPTVPLSLDNVSTNTVTVELGVVTARPDQPGIVAMGGENQEMRVISNDRF